MVPKCVAAHSKNEVGESVNLSDCQCIFCREPSLYLLDRVMVDHLLIHPKAIVCRHCAGEYDVIWGVPYLGVLEEADALSLIEIAANADNYRRESSSQADSGQAFAQWYDLLEGYHSSPDRAAFLQSKQMPPEVAGWLPNRHGEHVLFRGVTAGMDFRGKRVLDVGAGMGFDSFKFVRAGAEVTALEFSPILAHQGTKNLSQARWIGGNSSLLPFVSGTFDVVVANAALHHIRDIPATMREMLRVLKPGGLLLTLCDSYRNDQAGEEFEVNIFRDDAAVLMGVNEGIPRFNEFISVLREHHSSLEARLFTSTAYGVRSASQSNGLGRSHKAAIDYLYPREWQFEEAVECLPSTSGALALTARLTHRIQVGSRSPNPCGLRPGEFAQSLDSQAAGVGKAARHMPKIYVDLPLLGDEQGKFRLLNGWKPMGDDRTSREAYGRARRFVTASPGDQMLFSTVLVPHVNKLDHPRILLSVNGAEVGSQVVTRGLWTDVSGMIGRRPEAQPMSIEVRIETACSDPEAKTFYVREFQLGPPRTAHAPEVQDLERYGLEALAAVGALGTSPTRVLLSPDYAHNIEILNRLRVLGLGAEVIVPEGQGPFYRAEPLVKVVGEYSRSDSSAVVDAARGTSIVVASDEAWAQQAVPLFNAGRAQTAPYVILPGGHARIGNATGTVATMAGRLSESRLRHMRKLAVRAIRAIGKRVGLPSRHPT